MSELSKKMSETIKWDELTDKDKVKLILEYVIPHGMGDHIVFRDLHIVVERHEKPTRWPIAAWDDFPPGAWWIRDFGDDNDTHFDPLHDMNDAWKIVEHFKKPEIPGHAQAGFYRWLRAFSTPDPWDTTKDYVDWIYGVNADNICKAALKAVGVEIEG